MAQEFENRDSQDERIARTAHLRKIVLAMAGAVLGTISLCDLMAPQWGVLGWTVSVISLVRILAVPHRAVGRSRSRSSVVYRVVLASVAVFSLIFLTAMLTAFNANPQVLGRVEIVVGSLLAVVGAVSVALVLRMVRG